jgi:hypothetical protein
LNEAVGRILEVKSIPKMLKNHAKKSPSKRWDMHKKVDLKESKNNFRFPFG